MNNLNQLYNQDTYDDEQHESSFLNYLLKFKQIHLKLELFLQGGHHLCNLENPFILPG